MRPAPKGTLPAPIGLFRRRNRMPPPSPTQAAPSTPTHAQLPLPLPLSARTSLRNARAPQQPLAPSLRSLGGSHAYSLPPHPSKTTAQLPAVSSSGTTTTAFQKEPPQAKTLGGVLFDYTFTALNLQRRLSQRDNGGYVPCGFMPLLMSLLSVPPV